MGSIRGFFKEAFEFFRESGEQFTKSCLGCLLAVLRTVLAIKWPFLLNLTIPLGPIFWGRGILNIFVVVCLLALFMVLKGHHGGYLFF